MHGAYPGYDMRKGAAISAGLHVVLLAALLITLPHAVPPPPPPEESFAVDFEGHSDHAQKGETPGRVAAAADAEMEAHDNPAIKPPTKAPIETAPPPPPPPPPPPVPEETIAPPDIKTLEPPKPTPAPAPVKPPPPKPQVKPKPMPPQPPPPVKSTRAQPNPTKNPAPDTRALDNTLEKLMADQEQKAPPTHRYNPERGGKLHGGGAKSGGLTGELSDGQRRQIGDEVRRCYSEDTAAKDYATYSVRLVVTIDASGEARNAEVDPADAGHVAADPSFRAFAERAINAVLDSQCAKLPVPPDLLGKPAQTLNFRFRP